MTPSLVLAAIPDQIVEALGLAGALRCRLRRRHFLQSLDARFVIVAGDGRRLAGKLSQNAPPHFGTILRDSVSPSSPAA